MSLDIEAFDMSEELTVAVLTGNHRYRVRPFHDFFNGLDGIKAYVQNFDEWLTAAGEDDDDEEERDSYDVTLFYTMLKGAPEGKSKECIDHLFESGQPVFVLHHALLNCMSRGDRGMEPAEGDPWGEIIGLPDRRIGTEDIWIGSYLVEVNKDHPASVGLDDFEISDETYGIGDCTDDCDVLLTTSKRGSMQTLAWNRVYKNSRVFCLQLGHDPKCWQNPAFQAVLKNGLQWCAGDPG